MDSAAGTSQYRPDQRAHATIDHGCQKQWPGFGGDRSVTKWKLLYYRTGLARVLRQAIHAGYPSFKATLYTGESRRKGLYPEQCPRWQTSQYRGMGGCQS